MFPAEPNPRLDRARFELRTTGINPEEANPLRSGIHSRGYLPHVKREGARYFVTFRLADSLPKEVLVNHTLSEITQSLKRYTAREANRLLERTGQTFWQPEPYDHWIRNDEEHARCCRYVVNNPVNARLCAAPEDWKWSSACRGDAPAK